MFLSAYLAILCSQFPVDVRAGENKLTQLELHESPAGSTFEWTDADDSLRGGLTARPFRVEKSLTISAALEPLTGADFEGPLTFSFRPLDAMGSAQTQTVTRTPGGKTWVATFTPAEAVDHRFEISWRTTHHKVVRGVVSVGERGLPAWLNWVIGGGLVAVAVAIGLWILFARSKESPS